MHRTAFRIRTFLPIAVGIAGAVVLVLLWGQCNSGPPSGSLIVEGVDGWFLAVPEDVVTTIRADFGIKTESNSADTDFNLEIESTEFASMGSAGRGEWVRWRNQCPLEPGEYAVRVTSGSDRETLVEATITVDHDETPEHPCPGGDDLSELQEAREPDDFSLFWLGEDYDGIPLRSLRELRHGQVDLSYGTCRIIGNQTGCPQPLSVSVTACSYSIRPVPWIEVRGVPARQEGYIVSVWTKDALVVVNGLSAEQALEAAHALIPLEPGNSLSLTDDLPPPDETKCAHIPFPAPTPAS